MDLAIKPVVLGTDLLLFLLILIVVGSAWRARTSVPAREAWRAVGRSPAGMASGALLVCFGVVGLADSLHYRQRLAPTGEQVQAVYSGEVVSLLDAALAPLRNRPEKTYSAPFGTHLEARETIDLPGGGQIREYPRLLHGGAHLADPSNPWPDLGARTLRGLGLGLALALGLALVLAAARDKESPKAGFVSRMGDILLGRTELAWRAALASFAAAAVVAGVLLELAPVYHVFGTDKVGQDVLYLTLKSVRTALVIGTLTTLVLLPVAVGAGILAGFLGGWVDDGIQYVYTVLNSIPGVLLIAAAVLMMQGVIDRHPEWFATAAERADARLLALCFILGLTSWTGLARLLRAETLKLRELEYVQAARAFGVSTARILARHILPNLMHIVLIAVAMDFSGLVLAEAVLSYVGIGVDPGTVSFGTMINAARMELAREPMVWWSLMAAFLFMFVLVLSANLFADALRDAFDPRRG